jgi:tRNA(fMet)-specific endonuclease VapC
MRFVPVRRQRSREDGELRSVSGATLAERGYLFDTDLVAALLRKNPDTAVVRRAAAVPAHAHFICAITLGELLSGLPVEEQPALLARLQDLSHVVPVLPFDEASARTLGQLRQRMARARGGHGHGAHDGGVDGASGAVPSERDLQVAAIALSNGLVLVTADDAPYAGVPGLTVERWAS